jgi:diaminopimelate decarboxylase
MRPARTTLPATPAARTGQRSSFYGRERRSTGRANPAAASLSADAPSRWHAKHYHRGAGSVDARSRPFHHAVPDYAFARQYAIGRRHGDRAAARVFNERRYAGTAKFVGTMSLPAFFSRKERELMLEDVKLNDVAKKFGTPTYVYSRAAISAGFNAYSDALSGRPSLVCYAVKANSNIAVLDCLARLGAGFDIVSIGELKRVLAAGGLAKKVIFSGVGKSESEIEEALRARIRCFNVESHGELDRLIRAAERCGICAPVSFRVNPDVDPQTHPYISTGIKESKFGVAFEDALGLYQKAHASPHIDVTGIDCHIGSQLLDAAPLIESLGRLISLVDQLREKGIVLSHLDLGGGLGVRYRDESPVQVDKFIQTVLERIDAWRARSYGGLPIELLFEPGRSVVANAGVLLTRVEYLKQGAKNFAVVDAAMNDLLRPTLYDSWHEVVPLGPPGSDAINATWDVVGPVCESGDWLARERTLEIAPSDYLGILSAGAYAMAMASNYNTRARAAEVLIDGYKFHLVRKRETIEETFAGESRLPDS